MTDASPPRNAVVVAITNQKGGVGKTTSTVSLAAALAEVGVAVLVIDLDPQGNATTGLGMRAAPGTPSSYGVLIDGDSIEESRRETALEHLHLLPSSLDLAGAEIELVPAFSREQRLKAAINEVRSQYDVVFIDCPPSLGLLTINALTASDQVVVPIQCEYYALEGLGQLLQSIRMVSGSLNSSLYVGGIIMTMFDARTNLSQQVVDEVRKHFGEQVFRTVVPRSVRLSEAPSYGQPITVYDPQSRGSMAYRRLARELAGRLGIPLASTDQSPLERLLGPNAGGATSEPDRSGEDLPGLDELRSIDATDLATPTEATS